MDEIYVALGTRIYVRGDGVDTAHQVVESEDYVILAYPAESELEDSQPDNSTTEQSAHEASVKVAEEPSAAEGSQPDNSTTEQSAHEASEIVAEEVSAALAEDPKTSASVIQVVYDRGVITLSGIVENEEALASAEEIARCHEGVVSVVNALEVQQKSPFYNSVVHTFGGLMQRAYSQFS
jgi:osmotically-inducible protein OsmY